MVYEDMAIRELEAENRRLGEELNKLRKERKALVKVYDRKMADEAVKAEVADMSDEKKAALLQVLSPTGVRSEENVGTPGT